LVFPISRIAIIEVEVEAEVEVEVEVEVKVEVEGLRLEACGDCSLSPFFYQGLPYFQ
jgi:hypothetical protein